MTILSETMEQSTNTAESQQHRFTDNIDWFELLYAQCQDGWLTVWHMPEKITKWFHISQKAEALKYADMLAGRKKDVYFGMGLRNKQMGATQRGGRTDVNCVTCLWADIDVKDSAHSETELPASFDEAVQLVTSFPLLPSIIVKSANGLHVYWLLKHPWYFATEEDRKKAQTVLNQFQKLLIDRGNEHGWKLDNTSDLARVLRVPGTYNYKKPEHPVKVNILECHTERRYSPEQIEECLPVPKSSQLPLQDAPIQSGNVQLVIDNCAFIQHCRDDAASLPESDWFAMVSNLCRLQGGGDIIHQFSRPYAGYSVEEADRKIKHCLEDSGPHTCQYIQDEVGFGGCPSGGCGVKAPAAMATSAVFKAKLILKKLQQEVEAQPDTVFNKEYISVLGVLKSRDKAEYGKAITQIKEPTC